MAEDKEAFVSRWSRLKREQAAEEAKPVPAETPAPALPPVETLTPESDFTGFMHPKVKDSLRRVALKKLFSGDPHFNLPDPYEAYSGDWTVGEPIPPEMLATLNQARTVLFADQDKDKEKDKEQEKEQQPAAELAQGEAAKEVQEGESKQDEPGRKDA